MRQLHKAVRRQRIIVALAAAAIANPLVSCSRAEVATSTDSIFQLHQEYLHAKQDWLRADDEALLTLCAVAKAVNRRTYTTNVDKWSQAVAADPSDDNVTQQTQAQQRLTDLDSRIKECSSLASAPDLSRSADAADEAGTGAMWDNVQQTATKEINASIDLVNGFPTSSIRGMSYDSRTIDNLKAKRLDILTRVASLASDAVNVAKTASGVALKTARSDPHELDKQVANQADKSYSEAAMGLSAMSQLSDAGPIFAAADEVFANAGSAVGFAQEETGQFKAAVSSEGGTIANASFAPLSTPHANANASSMLASGTTASNRSTAVTSATDAVNQYYSLWNAKQYQAMYAMLSSRYQSDHSYESWLTEHESVQSISVQAAPVGSADVSVLIHSKDIDASGTVSLHTYRGVWHLLSENGDWKLDSASLQET